MLIWQRMTGTALGRVGKWGWRTTTWGSFPLDLDAHIGLGLFLLTVRFWWTSKKPQACKHNKAHEEWNVTLSCHNTIKWALKNFPASFILSKYAREKHELCCLSDFVFFLLHEKELSFQSLILANKEACQSLDTSGKGSDILNTKKTTLATQQHLEGHYPAEDIIHKAKKKSMPPWKYWYCSEIPAICPHHLICLPQKVTSNESRWWCMTL